VARGGLSPEEALARLRPTRATIDLDRLAANYRAVAALAQRPVMPVVKANAYGHGAARVGRLLQSLDVPMLAVAYVEEAVALREAGVSVPIVVLAAFAPAQSHLFVEHRLTPVVSTPETLEAALKAGDPDEPLAVHVKVDTGMSRLGFTREDFVSAVRRLADSSRTEVEGVMTHLAVADEDAAATHAQLDRFDAAVEDLAAHGIRPRWIHAANSGGLAFLRPTHTLVRPGLLIYGIRPRPLSPEVDVRPVMTVSTRIALVKEVPTGTPVSYGGRWVAPRPSRIATLVAGYADGVPRTDRMREEGEFRIGPRRAPVAGTVCMDLTMLDVTGLEVGEGDEAVLFGDDPTAWEVADWAGTNGWEVPTNVGARVPRVYVRGGRVTAVESRFLP
jgi:alanine racemase